MNKTFGSIPPSDIGISAATNMVGRAEGAASQMLELMNAYTTRQEEAARTISEYVSVLVDILVNDDGSMKDIANIQKLKGILNLHHEFERCHVEKMEAMLKSIPSALECKFSTRDRDILEKNFLSWKDVFRLYVPIRLILAFTSALCIIGGMWMMKTGIDMKRQYHSQIELFKNP